MIGRRHGLREGSEIIVRNRLLTPDATMRPARSSWLRTSATSSAGNMLKLSVIAIMHWGARWTVAVERQNAPRENNSVNDRKSKFSSARPSTLVHPRKLLQTFTTLARAARHWLLQSQHSLTPLAMLASFPAVQPTFLPVGEKGVEQAKSVSAFKQLFDSVDFVAGSSKSSLSVPDDKYEPINGTPKARRASLVSLSVPFTESRQD